MQSVLEDISFRDPARAFAEVSALTEAIPAAYHSKLKFLLSSSADPDTAVHYLGRMRQEQGEVFLELIEDDPALHYLITVFSYSRFLAEEVLQHPQWIEELVNAEDLYRVRSAEEYRERLTSWLGRGGRRSDGRSDWPASGATSCCGSCCATCSGMRRCRTWPRSCRTSPMRFCT